MAHMMIQVVVLEKENETRRLLLLKNMIKMISEIQFSENIANDLRTKTQCVCYISSTTFSLQS